MEKLERLLNLTAALLDTERPLSAEELREQIGGYPPDKASFRRAFERDKEELRAMGIPLRLEPVPGSDPPVDGYRIRPEDYYLDDPGLEPDELAALHLAATAVRFEGVGEQQALWKLGGVAGDTGATGDHELAAVPSDPALSPLFAAVTERRIVSFEYSGEVRTVEPWRLDFRRGRWYVTGYDRLRGAERHYRLDRIRGELGIGEPGGFDVVEPQASDLGRQPWQFGDEPPVEARVRFDADQGAWALAHVDPDAIERTEPDGAVVLRIPVRNESAFRSWVLGFGAHAEVLAPPALRASVVAWLEAMVAEDHAG